MADISLNLEQKSDQICIPISLESRMSQHDDRSNSKTTLIPVQFDTSCTSYLNKADEESNANWNLPCSTSPNVPFTAVTDVPLNRISLTNSFLTSASISSVKTYKLCSALNSGRNTQSFLYPASICNDNDLFISLISPVKFCNISTSPKNCDQNTAHSSGITKNIDCIPNSAHHVPSTSNVSSTVSESSSVMEARHQEKFHHSSHICEFPLISKVHCKDVIPGSLITSSDQTSNTSIVLGPGTNTTSHQKQNENGLLLSLEPTGAQINSTPPIQEESYFQDVHHVDSYALSDSISSGNLFLDETLDALSENSTNLLLNNVADIKNRSQIGCLTEDQVKLRELFSLSEERSHLYSNHLNNSQRTPVKENTFLNLKLSSNKVNNVPENSHAKSTRKPYRRAVERLQIRGSKLKNYDRLRHITGIPQPERRKGLLICYCGASFPGMYQYQRHAIVHVGEKRGALSLQNKIDIINKAKNGERHMNLAVEYNIGRSTLISIMKNSSKYEKLRREGRFSSSTMRMRKARNEDVEKALLIWYKQSIAMNEHVSGPRLCSKAREFAATLRHNEFKGTHGWLDRFKKRFKIVLGRNRALQNESQSCTSNAVNDDSVVFANCILPDSITDYNPCDIFFADEIGFLFKALPNDCVTLGDVRCSTGALSCKRFSILMCVNMAATEKLPLLVVGRYRKPNIEALNSSLNLTYEFNGKAWLTSALFESWLNEANKKLKRGGRKTLFFIRKTPVHSRNSTLSALKLVTVPDSLKGPVKLGISKALKYQYRITLMKNLIEKWQFQIETNSSKDLFLHPISFLDSLSLLESSWQNLSLAVISNSFSTAGLSIFPQSPAKNTDQPANESLELMHCLRSTGFDVNSVVTFSRYVTFDDDVQACQILSDQEIIDVVKNITSTSDSESELEFSESEPAVDRKN